MPHKSQGQGRGRRHSDSGARNSTVQQSEKSLSPAPLAYKDWSTCEVGFDLTPEQ